MYRDDPLTGWLLGRKLAAHPELAAQHQARIHAALDRLADLLDQPPSERINMSDIELWGWGVFYTLAEQGLNFPLKARALGELVEVVDLDRANSGLRRGIVALVRKGDREHSVALADQGRQIPALCGKIGAERDYKDKVPSF